MSRPPPTMMRCALSLPAPAISATITSHRNVRFMDSPSRSGEKSPETAATKWEIPPAKSIKRVRRSTPDPGNTSTLRLMPKRQADPASDFKGVRDADTRVLEPILHIGLQANGAGLIRHPGSKSAVELEDGPTD